MTNRSVRCALALSAALAFGAAADGAAPTGSAAARPLAAGAPTPRPAAATPRPVPPAAPADQGLPGTLGSTVGSYDPATGTYGGRRFYTAPSILADLILLRPFGLALTAAGAGLFLGTAPLSALASIAPPHDALERAGHVLFVAPAAFAFMRPLGEYTYQPSGVYPIRP